MDIICNLPFRKVFALPSQVSLENIINLLSVFSGINESPFVSGADMAGFIKNKLFLCRGIVTPIKTKRYEAHQLCI